MIDVSANDVYIVFYDDVHITKNFGVFESVKLADDYIITQVAEGYDPEYFTVEKWPVVGEIK